MTRRRILIILSHETVLRAEGHRERLLAILELLGGAEFGWLIPESLREREPIANSPTFTFREPAFGGLKIPYLVDWSRSFREGLREAVESFAPELLLCDLPWGASYAAKFSLPVVYLSHGVERDFADTTLLHMGLCYFPFTTLARALVGALEHRACTRAALTVAMSDHDVGRYRELFGVSHTIAIAQPARLEPIGALRDESRARWGLRSEEIVCIFHGSWHHVPNRVAGDAIRAAIAPAFVGQPVRFLLAGTGMEPFTDGNVIGVGFVDDLDTLLAAGDLALLPVLHGAGVRMKTFDYVRAHLPIVATAKAVEGVGFVDGRHAALSDNTIDDFIGVLRGTLADRVGWKRLANAAAQYVSEEHDPQKLRARLWAALERCINGSTDMTVCEVRR